MIAALFWLFVCAIFYVYAGFPLLLTLLARLQPRPQQYPPTIPHVTLLIPAYNEEAVIAQKLENSLQLDYPQDRLQILVTADGSDDRTPDIVKKYTDKGVELSYTPQRQGKMAAINRAVSHARGDIIIFSDANNIFTANVVRELVAPFTNPMVGAVSGAKSIVRGDGALGESEGLYWKYEAFIKKQETRLGCCTSVAGEILAIRRSLIEPCPDSIINDDFYMAMRLIKRGYRIIYASNARSLERVSLSAQDEIVRRARIVAGRYQALAMLHKLIPLSRPILAWQIISHKFLRPLVPLVMAGALLSNISAVIWPTHTLEYQLLHLAPPFNWIILILQGLFYGLAWMGNHVNGSNITGRLLYLPTFLVNSNIAAIIGFYGFITKQQTPLWERAQRREIAADILEDKVSNQEQGGAED